VSLSTVPSTRRLVGLEMLPLCPSGNWYEGISADNDPILLSCR
jgi:hypothetical protein